MAARQRPPLVFEQAKANSDGIQFEMKMCALVYLRALQLPLEDFALYNNVRGLCPADDLVLCFKMDGQPYRVQVQLKQRRREDSCLKLMAFCPKGSSTGEYNLKRYLKCHQRLRDMEAKSGKTEDEIFLCETPLENVWYIIHCTERVRRAEREYPQSITAPQAENGGIEQLLHRLFSTRAERPSFRFTEKDEVVWDFVEDEEEKEVYQEDFLPHLLVFDGQSHVDRLDELIHEEISRIYSGNIREDRFLYDQILKEVDKWFRGIDCWGEDHLVEVRNGKKIIGRKGCPLSSDSYMVERAMAEYLRTKARNDANYIEKCLPCEDHNYLLQLIQMLDGDQRTKDCWCCVNKRDFLTYPGALLQATCRICNTIIFNCDYARYGRKIMEQIKEMCHYIILFHTSMITENFLDILEANDLVIALHKSY